MACRLMSRGLPSIFLPIGERPSDWVCARSDPTPYPPRGTTPLDFGMGPISTGATYFLRFCLQQRAPRRIIKVRGCPRIAGSLARRRGMHTITKRGKVAWNDPRRWRVEVYLSSVNPASMLSVPATKSSSAHIGAGSLPNSSGESASRIAPRSPLSALSRPAAPEACEFCRSASDTVVAKMASGSNTHVAAAPSRRSASVMAPVAIALSPQARTAAWNACRHNGRQNLCVRPPVRRGRKGRSHQRHEGGSVIIAAAAQSRDC
jgi:hypothetical protein